MKKKNFKYICTLGQIKEQKLLEEMYNNGMYAIRTNMSYKKYELSKDTLEFKKSHPDVELMLDTAGPEIRLVMADKVAFNEGDIITFGKEINVTLNNLNLLEIGDIVSIKDGEYSFEVVEKIDDCVNCVSLESGILENNNKLYNEKLYDELPFISEWDKEVLNMAVKFKVDSIALSFVRNAANVLEVREILKKLGNENIKIIAKIENKQGLENITDIINVSDEIMVARGDLGAILPRVEVAKTQKKIIDECIKVNKKVIVATGILASMEKNAQPTVAEVSDLYSIISSGADAALFSREFALSSNPINILKTANEIYDTCE